jgi:signal transduction histidine kinase
LIEKGSLLARAKGEVGIVKKESVVLSNIIQEMLKELSPIAIKKNIKIEHIAPPDAPQVLVVVQQAKEIFSNLIDNAIKYNKDGGAIIIAHSIEGNFLKTTVKDTGADIGAENFSKLFTPYFRASASEAIQGTGLGLFIVKKFVEELGGKVSVESKIGEGTVFTVYLPLAV